MSTPITDQSPCVDSNLTHLIDAASRPPSDSASPVRTQPTTWLNPRPIVSQRVLKGADDEGFKKGIDRFYSSAKIVNVEKIEGLQAPPPPTFTPQQRPNIHTTSTSLVSHLSHLPPPTLLGPLAPVLLPPARRTTNPMPRSGNSSKLWPAD